MIWPVGQVDGTVTSVGGNRDTSNMDTSALINKKNAKVVVRVPARLQASLGAEVKGQVMKVGLAKPKKKTDKNGDPVRRTIRLVTVKVKGKDYVFRPQDLSLA